MNTIAVLLSIYKNDNSLYLTESIESILRQTYQDFLILIGVDGPVGKSLEDVLVKYEKNDKIEVVKFNENRGLACVLNDLIECAKAKNINYLARMDADDIALPDRFEKQLIFLLQNESIDVVGGAITEIDGEGNLKNKTVKYPETPEQCRAFFSKRDPLAHPTAFFRFRYFDKVGHYYRPNYRKNQDTMLWFDGFKAGCLIANISDVVLKFRTTDDFFKNRRNGLKRAVQYFKDRLTIIRELGYGFDAKLFNVLIFIVTISPAWIKKLAYKLR